MTRRRPAFRLLTGVAAAALLAAACSGEGGGSTGASTTVAASPTTVASPTTRLRDCADTAALEAAVTALRDVDLVQVGVDGLRAALADVADELEVLAAGARAEWSPEIAELRGAVDALVTTVTGLDDDATRGANLQAVRAALDRVGDAWTALERQVDESC
jgi:hypothetical protein